MKNNFEKLGYDEKIIKKSSVPFVTEALWKACVIYLYTYRPANEWKPENIGKLIRAAEVDENDTSKKPKLDRIFEEVALKDPYSMALKYYKTYKTFPLNHQKQSRGELLLHYLNNEVIS